MVRQLLSDFPEEWKATNFILPQTPQTISTEKNGYREAAEQGDAKAQNSLGHMYLAATGRRKTAQKQRSGSARPLTRVMPRHSSDSV